MARSRSGLSATQEEKREDADISPELQAELENIEEDVRHESVFGATASESREARKEADAIRERMAAVGYVPGALSVPWWPESQPRWLHKEGP